MRICLVHEDRTAYESLAHDFPAAEWFRDAETFLDDAGSLDARVVVVADVQLPGMDGIELVRQLRRRGCAVPVILMGHGDIATAVEAIRSGAADFIEKPVAGGALAASIHRLIRGHDYHRQTTFMTTSASGGGRRLTWRQDR